jgi:uncharacterized membrane protein (DUF2068 family)
MTPQAKALWNKWLLQIFAFAVLLPITVYQLFHNWGEWLFLSALGLAWFLFVYRFVGEFRAIRRTPDQGSAPRPT